MWNRSRRGRFRNAVRMLAGVTKWYVIIEIFFMLLVAPVWFWWTMKAYVGLDGTACFHKLNGQYNYILCDFINLILF